MPPPRLHVETPLAQDLALALPAGAARHVQVLRLQPGAEVTLFDGRGGEWSAQIVAIERRGVQVRALEHRPRECELPLAVTLAVAMPANDRMDDLVEKATELGAAVLQPLLSERAVLRLTGERAERRRAHWQAIAAAACEQCGRNRVPQVAPVQTLSVWLDTLPPANAGEARLLLGWHQAAPWSPAATAGASSVTLLSGPEGGLTEAEETAARRCGFTAVSLGPRVLRADTAPLAALASLALTG